MRVYSGTDIGRRRSENQDYIYGSDTSVGNLPNLFVVADGMGGHRAGSYASSHAVDILVNTVKNNADYNPVRIMRYGIEEANREILRKAEESEERKGMGTTMVVATIVGELMYVANVGDSRLYLIDNEIRQITKDHSLVQEMVRVGELSQEEARNHPEKNIITRALGAEFSVDIDFFDIDVDEGSTILLCSDGLTNMVEDREIREIVKHDSDLNERGQSLLDAANNHGGMDNISVVLVEPFAEEVKKC